MPYDVRLHRVGSSNTWVPYLLRRQVGWVPALRGDTPARRLLKDRYYNQRRHHHKDLMHKLMQQSQWHSARDVMIAWDRRLHPWPRKRTRNLELVRGVVQRKGRVRPVPRLVTNGL